MDFGDLGKLLENLSFLVPVIIFIVFNVVFRKQKQQQTRLSVVRSLQVEIEHNQKVMEALSLRWQTRKFKTGTWKRHRDKMDYISPELHHDLSEAFTIAEEFNREIDAAKKHNSMSYLSGLKVDRLKEPFARSKQGLEEWLRLNKGKGKLLTRSR